MIIYLLVHDGKGNLKPNTCFFLKTFFLSLLSNKWISLTSWLKRLPPQWGITVKIRSECVLCWSYNVKFWEVRLAQWTSITPSTSSTMLYVDWVSVDPNLTSRVFSGHSGFLPPQKLTPSLKSNFQDPIDNSTTVCTEGLSWINIQSYY